MGCARKVERTLTEKFNVSIQELSPTHIKVETDTSFKNISQAIQPLGYRAGTPLTFQLDGLHCGNCVKKLTKAFDAIDDIDVKKLTTQELEVDTLLDSQRVVEIVRSTGFDVIEPFSECVAKETSLETKTTVELGDISEPVSLSSTSLLIGGMTCASCVSSVEKALNSVSGVNSAQVNLAEQSATVRTDSNTPIDALIHAVTEAGYQAEVLESNNRQNAITEQYQHQMAHHKRSAIMGLSLGIPIMLWGLLGGSMMIHSTTSQIGWGVIAILTLALLSTAGANFFLSAYKSFKHKRATMDTLVALGTGAAWLYSTAVVLMPNTFPELARHVYFEASCMIIGLISLGHFIESRAKIQTTTSLKKLLDLQPSVATQVLPDGDKSIAVSDITEGMILKIKAGAQVPIDGIVIEGESYVDESMLTGEPVAVTKQVGDAVSAGTLNQDGRLVIKATGVGKDTMLAKIIELVRQAQASKPAITKMTDQIAAVFVPIVIAIALITMGVWFVWGPEPQINYMLVVGTTVLIIACPCALGLATPLSVTVGIGKAAELGILVRDAQVLQTARKVDTIVFDKTGTLTQGRPKVQSCEFFTERDTALNLLYSVETNSEHPLAKAIIEYAQEHNAVSMNLNGFETLRGKGVSAKFENDNILVGSISFLEDKQVDMSIQRQKIEQMQSQGWTVIGLARNSELQTLIGISDPIKDDAIDAVETLHSQGIKTVMLTGDHPSSANEIARILGIDEVIAEVLPDQKAEKIKQLQQNGHIVAMVGDGINDAPALSQANLSIAMASGSDIAIESAQMTLLNSAPSTIYKAISLSKATVGNIKQNLVGAFIYNIIGIPIAAGLLYPFFGVLLNPMVAGAAMALSSITVVTNANRLRLFK
jgi:Cu+-exporting ATPase